MRLDQNTEEKETSEIATARNQAKHDNEKLQVAEQREEQAKQAFERAQLELKMEKSSYSHRYAEKKA
jgi:hypothetical protein